MLTFYREPSGDYLAVFPGYPSALGASFFAGRAPGIAGLPTSVTSCSMSAAYLGECAPVPPDDVPDEWYGNLVGQSRP